MLAGFLSVMVVCHGLSQVEGTNWTVFENEKEKVLLGAEREPLDLFMALHATPNMERAAYDKLVAKLDKLSKRKHFEEWFLEEVFYKAHQYVLKEYRKHSTFNETMVTGDYDCVSGSALYGLLMQRYGFKYEVIETDFHVFVLVHSSDGKTYVLESTEPQSGFIKDKQAVDDYIASFQPSKSKGTRKGHAELAGLRTDDQDDGREIYSSITLTQLAGLHNYNDAIHHFNEGKRGLALKQLIKARAMYASERIEGLYSYLSSVEADMQELARR